ncbi:MAG: hypothetical protein JWR09_1468 [Mucilaginibacter sp.]|nr:hypothetical protein [Mucilaginibacter sp.]
MTSMINLKYAIASAAWQSHTIQSEQKGVELAWPICVRAVATLRSQ